MPQPELKPEEWQNLLDRYKIVFERPITPNKWPKEYAKIFGVIRNISRIWMQDYEKDASNDFDILSLGDKKARAAQLVNSARHCLTTFKNEDDWRELTEDKIFARFYSEVIWCAVIDTIPLEHFTMSNQASQSHMQKLFLVVGF